MPEYIKSGQTLYRIEIKSAGEGDKWWNNKIGNIYNAYKSKHPCNPSIKGYAIGAFFIPGKHVEVANEIRDLEYMVRRTETAKGRYTKKGRKTAPVYAFNVDEDKEYFFDSMSEASEFLNIPRPTILKYSKLNKPYMGYHFVKQPKD